MRIKSLSLVCPSPLKLSLLLLVAMAVLSAAPLPVRGGAPLWPPPRHSAEYRKASMLFLRFQDALAAGQWTEALSLCSPRVRAKAADWPSPGAFFQDTVPIDLLLAQDFRYWRDSSDSYGLMVPLTEPKANPALRWFGAIAAANGT